MLGTGILIALTVYAAYKIIQTYLCPDFTIKNIVKKIKEIIDKIRGKVVVVMPKKETDVLIKSIRKENPDLARKLESIFDDKEETKLGLTMDEDKNILDVNAFKAENQQKDEFKNLTAVFADGRIKVLN